MERALIKFNPDDSHTDHKRRTREVRNDSLKQNCIPSVSRTTAKIYGNAIVSIDHMIDDDDSDKDWALFMATYSGDDVVDEDYGSLVPTYDPNIENDSVEVDYKSFLFAYNPDIVNQSHEVDEDYKSFLHIYNPDDIENDDDEADKDYESFLLTYDPDVQIDSGGSDIDVNFGKNNQDCGLLDPVMIVDGDEEYMLDKNTTIAPQLEDGSDSSDSDLIVLDSYPNCQDTPFVPSKLYDSSWFGEAKNPKDNLQMAAYDDSQFRRTLMEHLDKPYDHEEYKNLIIKLCNKSKKERHFETRRRVVESYQSEGVTTPFHETYPDLAEAIAKVSTEKPKVLFLLRGFFFWLEVELSNQSLANAMCDCSFELDAVMARDIKHWVAPLKQ